ncbi:MAG: hypothetical protein JF628_04385 [Sphingomonas sp.]|nr:hypothetical protein [Sphingomonas sp.]
MRQSIVMLLAAMFSAATIPTVPSLAAEATKATADPVGDWIGTVDPGSPVRVAVHIRRVDGALTGTADSPDQGAFGIVMSEVTLDGDHLDFEIDSIDGRYVSTWDATKQHYVGTWTQGGRMLALELGRGSYPPPAAISGH